MNTVLGMNDVPDLMEKAERALINIQDTIINSTDATFMNTAGMNFLNFNFNGTFLKHFLFIMM